MLFPLAILAFAPARPAVAQGPLTRTLLDLGWTEPGARLGEVVAAAGDLNRDGLQDFALGQPNWGPATLDRTGRVLVFLGGKRMSGQPDLELRGTQAGGQFGAAIAGIGDVDGDGYDDLLVTAPEYAHANPSSMGSGRAYLYRGAHQPDSQADEVIAPPVLPPSAGGYRLYSFGMTAAGLGDVDGDGYPDYGIAFGRSSVGSGGATYFQGGHFPPVSCGYSLSGAAPRTVISPAGDLDGNGTPDFVIGVPLAGPGSAIGVRIFTEGIFGSVTNRTFTQSTSDGGNGSSLAPAGDLNGDGIDDLLIGYPRATGAGTVLVLYGSTTLGNLVPVPPVYITAGAPADSFGCTLAVGPLTADGSRQILVGACGDDTGGPGAGAVRIYRINPGAPPTLLGVTSGQPGDYFGYSLALAGDVDANGSSDLLVGTPRRSSGANFGGGARLLSASPHTLLGPDGGQWPAGGTIPVEWSGAAPARVFLSLDNGVTWTSRADHAGGAALNRLDLAVPDTTTALARLRLAPAGAAATSLPRDDADYSASIVRPALAPPLALRVREVRRDPGSARLGAVLVSGPLDPDGREVLLAGAPWADDRGANAGRVDVLDPGGDPTGVLLGDRAGDLFGSAVAIGDLDGDGRAEFAVGAPGASGGAGECRVFEAGATTPRLRLLGAPGEGFGRAVCALRDWNGDGEPDLAVAAPYAPPPDALHGPGRVDVFFGGPAMDGIPDARLFAPPSSAGFGTAMCEVIGFDGLDHDQFAVSAPGNANTPGRVFLFHIAGAQSLSFELRPASPEEGFGEVLAPAGDLNGDRTPDFAVGNPSADGTGRVDLFYGGPGIPRTPALSIGGRTPGERFGAAVLGAGDLDGDGRDDLLVGAPLAGSGGAVRVFPGGGEGRVGAEWSDAAVDGRMGAALAVVRWSGGVVPRVLFAGAPLDGGGSVTRLVPERWVVTAPAPGSRWIAGGRAEVRWRGAEPADVSLSTDAGRHWIQVAAAAGGDEVNGVLLEAPAAPTDSALVRLTPSRPAVTGTAECDGRFAIHNGTLLSFRAELAPGGVRLAWHAEPGVGEDGWRGYRLYRRAEGESLRRIGPDSLQVSTLEFPETRRDVTYLLHAIGAFGGEFELGTATLPGAGAPLRAWPVPAGAGRAMTLAMFPPLDETGLTLPDFQLQAFDLSGRRVRRIAGGRVPTVVGEARVDWDVRDGEGRLARPGVYFVRAECPSRNWRSDRRVVVLP